MFMKSDELVPAASHMVKRIQVSGLNFNMRNTFRRMLRPGINGTRGTWMMKHILVMQSLTNFYDSISVGLNGLFKSNGSRKIILHTSYMNASSRGS